MCATRVHVDLPLAAGDEVALPVNAAHHVRTVLRLARDDEVVLFDGHGGEFRARLTTVARERVVAAVLEARTGIAESPLALTLVQAISRGERMDYTLQKAVELGVSRVVPVISRRTVVRLDAAREERRIEHWRGILRHAAEQCGRAVVPALDAVATLDQWLARRDNEPAFLLHPAAAVALAAVPDPGPRVTLLAGPEGGFDGAEVERLVAAGVLRVRLGPRVLRTETAAVVAMAVLQARFGDLA